ncbi:MAG: hypothetical protein E6371_18830 [Terrisporobacter othiniensis]|uniref:hypothetical protein n=1 Tax=Terrisporobacter othiniensis TaxID=1577792 RepID=UPI0013793AA2|nr:hypothetical protein [Terrisporobacter othiniensis]MDU6986458.1 hypothetical protein [Terrisporobacter othiniensis]
MNLISYLSLFFGILLLIPAIMLNLSGLIRYLIALLAVILIVSGVLMNKSL